MIILVYIEGKKKKKKIAVFPRVRDHETRASRSDAIYVVYMYIVALAREEHCHGARANLHSELFCGTCPAAL